MPMVRHNSGAVLRRIQALLDAGTFCGLSDGQLLERFLARRDEVSELGFFTLTELPEPIYPIHTETIEDYRTFDGRFIVK